MMRFISHSVEGINSAITLTMKLTSDGTEAFITIFTSIMPFSATKHAKGN